MLKGYARASQANMTVRGYERIFCSNMMKINQDIFRESLKETRIDLFMENSERPKKALPRNVQVQPVTPLLSPQSAFVDWPVSPTSTTLTGCSGSSGGRTGTWAALCKMVSV